MIRLDVPGHVLLPWAPGLGPPVRGGFGALSVGIVGLLLRANHLDEGFGDFLAGGLLDSFEPAVVKLQDGVRVANLDGLF
jgi:hypothetical protein